MLFFTIVALNLYFASYEWFNPPLWLIVATVLIYSISISGLFRIVSCYLLSGKYLWFIIYVVGCAFLFTSMSNAVFYYYIDDFQLFSEATLADCLSDFSLYVLCISGVVVPVFLKNWLTSSQHLNEMKIKKMSSQVEQFKEQINPTSFFKILSKSESSVKTEPDRASAMLMKLADLLRYQLYDCNRERVLLTAEISFLRNFLELEKLYSSKFSYSIETTSNLTGIFVLPTVIVPYLQSIINALDADNASHNIHVWINSTEGCIDIRVSTSSISDDKLLHGELLKVRERLNTLYADKHELKSTNNPLTGETALMLQLNTQ